MTLFQNMRDGLLPARLTVDEIYDLTAAGVLAENERIELIEGEVVPMAAAKANWHSIMEGKLTWTLVKQLPDELRLSSSIAHAFGWHAARARSSGRSARRDDARLARTRCAARG